MVSGAARRGEAGGPAAVLAGDRGRALERGRGAGRRRIPGGGIAVGPEGRRHASITSGAVGAAVLGAAPVVRRARGDRAAEGSGPRRAGDRPAGRPRAAGGLAGAAAQRGDAQRPPGVPCHDRAVARPRARRGGRRPRSSRRTTPCAATWRTAWRGGSRGPTASSSTVPALRGGSVVTAPGRRADGRGPGALSRSPPGSSSTSPRTPRCASPTRRSIAPSTSRAVARLAA